MAAIPDFQFHKLNRAGQLASADIGSEFEKLHNFITAFGGDARCQAVAATKLEEACFFAKKAMAKNPDYQDNA